MILFEYVCSCVMYLVILLIFALLTNSLPMFIDTRYCLFHSFPSHYHDDKSRSNPPREISFSAQFMPVRSKLFARYALVNTIREDRLWWLTVEVGAERKKHSCVYRGADKGSVSLEVYETRCSLSQENWARIGCTQIPNLRVLSSDVHWLAHIHTPCPYP